MYVRPLSGVGQVRTEYSLTHSSLTYRLLNGGPSFNNNTGYFVAGWVIVNSSLALIRSMSYILIHF